MTDAVPEHPLCETCGGQVERRPRERHYYWLARRSCSPECKAELLSRSRTKRPGGRQDHAGCMVCHGQVPRRPGEQRTKWIGRRTCSDVCLAITRAALMGLGNQKSGARRRATAMTFDHPPCKACGEPIMIHDDEAPADWRKRKTCRDACHSVLRKRKRGKYKLTVSEIPPVLPVEQPVAKPKRKLAWAPSKKAAQPAKENHPAAHFETVEEALARGVRITRIETPVLPDGAVPVRSKYSRFSADWSTAP